jgi:ATP phosphoribosyltransferase
MIRIAIPNKGRLCEPSMKLLKDAGIKLEDGMRKTVTCEGNEVLYARAQDIPEYVQDGAADIGVTGFDQVMEKKAKVDILLKLGFGGTSLVLAVPNKSKIKRPNDLPDGVRVATVFPNLTTQYFKRIGVKAKLVSVSGATEITPALGVADVIVDLTSTGATLKENNLRIVDTLLDSEAVLISNKKCKDRSLLLSIRSVMEARGRRYLMVNVPKKKLSKAISIIPGLESPTIMDLAEKGFVALHSVVDDSDVQMVIRNLKKIGAKDILVLPIERLVK